MLDLFLMSDHYTTLGINKTATTDEIKRAYRRLASQHHPDKGGSKEEFQRIQQAYDVLGDDHKRAQYDNPGPQFGGFPGGFHFNFGGPGFNFNDVFEMFGQRRGPNQEFQRRMVRMSLWIRLYDAAVGGRRPVSVATPQGTSTIEIDIPLGVNDGDTVKYSELAPGGGDLAIQFRIHPDATWARDGLNLITEKTISIWDLILGSDLEVTDITGKALSVRVPPKTQPQSILRLRAHGLRNAQGSAGDLLVKVVAAIPEYINSELIEAIKNHRD